jgi:hypothetical protein
MFHLTLSPMNILQQREHGWRFITHNIRLADLIQNCNDLGATA